MQKEIELAYQTVMKKKDDLAIVLALSPFARKTAELVNSGAYEAAAASCYVLFRYPARGQYLTSTAKRLGEEWFFSEAFVVF